MASTDFVHDPVLVSEVVESLRVEKVGWILDGTVGRGGHAAHLLESFDGARLIGLDQDREALEAAEAVLRQYGDRVLLREGNFRQLDRGISLTPRRWRSRTTTWSPAR